MMDKMLQDEKWLKDFKKEYLVCIIKNGKYDTVLSSGNFVPCLICKYQRIYYLKINKINLKRNKYACIIYSIIMYVYFYLVMFKKNLLKKYQE